MNELMPQCIDKNKPIAICPNRTHLLFGNMGAMGVGVMWMKNLGHYDVSKLPILDCRGGFGKTCEEHENA